MLGLTRELGGRFFLNLARTTPALPCERVTCTASRVSTQLLITNTCLVSPGLRHFGSTVVRRSW